MNRPAPRSIDEYLRQLRDTLSGEDPALVQDALYDAEEYLRAEVAAHPGKSEGDVLELIASTYGAPDEVAAAYRDTEAKVKAALQTPPPKAAASPSAMRRFFGIFSDVRAYTSLFYMFLAFATGIVYFVFAVTGLSMSLGFALLIIGLPFFLAFIGISRVISLGEGRLIEALTGERMPRRPVHPGPKRNWWERILDMLKDARTWTTLGYFVLMLPIGIAYFVIALTGITVGASLTVAPFIEGARWLGWFDSDGVGLVMDGVPIFEGTGALGVFGLLLMLVAGVLLLTVLMHAARGIGRVHARMAKSLLVTEL
jgi:uncharacterized membrane protein